MTQQKALIAVVGEHLVEVDEFGQAVGEVALAVRRHGDGRPREAIPQPVLRPVAPAEAADGQRDFSDSLTEFIDLDKMFADHGN